MAKILKAPHVGNSSNRCTGQDQRHRIGNMLFVKPLLVWFTPGVSPPNVCVHKSPGIRNLVHGYDFASAGEIDDLAWMSAKP